MKTEQKKFYLSGDHDQDYFLSKSDLGDDLWDILLSCYHQGACDDDCQAASYYFDIEDYTKAYDYLSSTGIEMDDFLDSDHQIDSDRVFLYYIWMIAGDISEREGE